MWYNSTSSVWKVEEATAAGAWASGNNMNTARFNFRQMQELKQQL
jgi:hypothetical protein